MSPPAPSSSSSSSSPILPPAKRARSKSPEHPTETNVALQSNSSNGSLTHPLASTSNGAHSAATTTLPTTSSSTSDPNEKAALKAEARRARNKRKDYAKQLYKTGREPIEFDIEQLLGIRKYNDILSEGREYQNKFERDTQLTLVIDRLDSHGDGLALASQHQPDWVVAVNNALPGEKVVAQVTSNERMYSKAKLVQILEPSPERNQDLVKCRYFGECGGCQYQMLDYEKQLNIKRGVVEKAFARFSGLDASLIPNVSDTLPSPKQYHYRTKLTPHFELPKELWRGRRGNATIAQNGEAGEKQEYDVPIGFDRIGTKKVMDIEECPIATLTINKALNPAKQKVRDNIQSFKNGATVLLRDSLKDYHSFAEDLLAVSKQPSDQERALETEVVSDYKATVKERVLTTKFESPAGTFFQNNRSILPSLLEYVRQAILSSDTGVNPSSGTSSVNEQTESKRYLVDAYCGSGLFSLCLADLFEEVSGVEIHAESIRYATKNAELNSISNAKFLTGNAEDIFAKIEYPPSQTTVIIDPPRRGCDEEFLRQLVNLGPKHIVYVSCNVHTQARDVGQLIQKDASYTIKTITGADLFPQTHHVEGVCVLEKRTNPV